MKRDMRVMIAICYILSTELSYVLLPGKEIGIVCSERAWNKSIKFAPWSTFLFMWLLNNCVLMMSMKQLGIERIVTRKIFGHISSQLNGCVKSPGGFHLIYSELISLDLMIGTWLSSDDTALISVLQKLYSLPYEFLWF